MKNIRFTKIGFDKLKKDYENLQKNRPIAVADLKKARDMGDLSENGYYKAARSKLSEIDRNLRTLLYEIKNAVVIAGADKNAINIGSIIRLSDGKKEIKLSIVGDLEANPSLGKISLLSPIGQAVENKKAGDKVDIATPSGIITYKIISIS
ncbi:MAG: GreA/GreB family elongation factor [Patescibacteria group bacterium]